MTTRARNRTRTTRPGSFALTHAQRTFDPFNTEDCPQLFADKWTAGD